MDYRFINVRQQGEIAVLELDDPSANTLTYDLLHELEYKFLKLDTDPSVKAILLTGKGTRFFSGGVNIGMLLTAGRKFNSNFILYAAEVLEFISASRKLVVAAINGNITGGGLEVALAAQRRVAVSGDYNIGFPEVRLGVIPGMGGTQRLSRLIGPQTALELITQGRFIRVEQAREIGLVDRIFPADGFMDQALAFVEIELADSDYSGDTEDQAEALAQLSASLTFADADADAEGLVTLAIENGTALISFTDATRATDCFTTLRAFNEALLKVRIDESAHGLVIDMSQGGLRQESPADLSDYLAGYAKRLFARIDGYPRLCAVLIGGSLNRLETELCLACDYRFCSAAGLAETVALPAPGLPQLERYFRQIPAAWAGQEIVLAQLVESGLFQAIDQSDTPLRWLFDYMARFQPPMGSSSAIGYAKLAISKGYAESVSSALLLERHLQEQLFIGSDSQEGMRAYLEKRTPQFKGA